MKGKLILLLSVIMVLAIVGGIWVLGLFEDTGCNIPLVLSFPNTETYFELLEAGDLSDDAFLKFLETDGKEYSMNGIHRKTDIQKLQETISAMPFPQIFDGHLTIFHYYPEKERMEVAYQLDDGVTVGLEVVNNNAAEQPQGESIKTERLGNVFVTKSDWADVFCYEAYVSGHRLSIRVHTDSRSLADSCVERIGYAYLVLDD